jgi:hypothetical protein
LDTTDWSAGDPSLSPGNAQRLPVQRIQLLQSPQQRVQDLVEDGEAQVDLELGTGSAHHLCPGRRRVCCRSVQQHRLADPGIPDSRSAPVAGWGHAEAAAGGLRARRPGCTLPAPQSPVVHREELADERVQTDAVLATCLRH